MFETVVPAIVEKKSNVVMYETLPLSLGLHAIVAAALLAASVWTVGFPDQSPPQAMSFAVADTPPPPPPPPPPPQPMKAAEPELKPLARIPDVVAPVIIPEEIPKVEVTSVVATTEGVEDGVEGGIPGGEAGGVFGGLLGGERGGVLGGVIGGVGDSEPKDVVKVARDKPLPLYPISQVYPAYPDKARMNAWEDQLVVRYKIGKDGRVKEVTIISKPERDIFSENTIKAIKAWRFRPFIKNGERLEVVHELTVNYRLVQS